ncbi:GDP-mannose 4,6-dehydratase [Candidatus Micrarchaeota archaeon]|nr:GDP-mannose 4,6-dehydratase [Candidatus Micrarchaeota archaeon]MBU1165649.1 GDP-mannose 4,6-dehydratase [Candidatus Micrarchaeota archaeon]
MKNNKDYFDSKRILITGATGLIGPWLVEDLLNCGSDVTCLIRDHIPDSRFFTEKICDKVNLANGDLVDYPSVERVINEYEPEIVIHLGAQAIVGTAKRSPLGTFESNIKGTWNVLEACRVHDSLVKSIVVASSDKAYGDQEKLPYTEASPMMGTNPYDASKSCADLISQCYGKTYSLPLSISRCGNFFGGGDLNFSRIVPGTLKSAYADEAPTIRSDGTYIRDYIYVKDAVSAYKVLAKATAEKQFHGEAFNFSNEIQLTVLQMVGKILKACGKENLNPVVQNKATNEIKNQHLDASKAKKILGWKSEWGIDDGLKETAEWYHNYFSK